MNYGWFLDGFSSDSAGFSVLDSFVISAGASVNKTYTTDVLKHANSIKLFTVISAGSSEYVLYQYPVLAAALNKSTGIATVTGTGSSYPFFVVVFIQ